MAAMRFEVSADSRADLTRLAHHYINGTIHTWDTRVEVHLERDGSGTVRITRAGRLMLDYQILAETDA